MPLGIYVSQVASSSGGSGAPADAQYVTLATNATLTNERVLTAGTNISIVDNGAGSTVVISASAATWTETEVDFGTAPTFNKSFTVTDAAVSAASKVAIVPSGKAPTGLTADEWEWDIIQCAADPAAGSFTVRCLAIPGPVMGKRKLQYQVA